MLGKPFLIGWAKKVTAQAAARDVKLLATLVERGGESAAAAWLKEIPDFERDTAGKMGTAVHILAEAIARKQPVVVTEAQQPFVDRYVEWLAKHKPKFKNVEFMVYSASHLYGGTADAVVELNGELWLIDYKTGKDAYTDTALQLAAYAFADWAGKPGDPRKYAIPKVTRFGVLHIRPDHADLIPYSVTAAEYEAFLACRRLFDWKKYREPIVKGEVELVKAA